MRQRLLWIPPAVDRKNGAVPRPPPVPLDGPEPDQVWTLYTNRDESSPPTLPIRPAHLQGAFAEDYIHDWNLFRGYFSYGSRAIDGGVWVLLEYKK